MNSATLAILISISASVPAFAAKHTTLNKKNIIALMRKVNAYQQAHPWTAKDCNRISATFYTGVMSLYETTKDRAILNQAMKWAQECAWAEGDDEETPADNMARGRTYLEVYFLKKDPAMIAKMRVYVDGQIEAGLPGHQIWGYSDALFVAPPMLAMMAKATGDRKYLDYLNKMYWDVANHLFDKRYGPFYRDKSYFNATTPNGRKVFWSRGNGWVIADIPGVLAYLPKDAPQRSRYVDLFRTLAASIAKVQGPDGLWRSNLADPNESPNPETSGSAFFCYALAWGVHHGYLPATEYKNTAIRAWRGLVRMVQPDGRLGYV